MTPVRDESCFKLLGQKRLAGVPPAGDEHNRGSMAILLGSLFDADFTLDPGKIPAARFLAQSFLLGADRVRRNGASGDSSCVREQEAAWGVECGGRVEGDLLFRAERKRRDMGGGDHLGALLLSQVHRMGGPMDGASVACDRV